MVKSAKVAFSVSQKVCVEGAVGAAVYSLQQTKSNINDSELIVNTNYLENNNKRSDVKNIQLFKLLVKNELTSKEISSRLYSSNKPNAYHAFNMQPSCCTSWASNKAS